jgi:hypothetical protein
MDKVQKYNSFKHGGCTNFWCGSKTRATSCMIYGNECFVKIIFSCTMENNTAVVEHFNSPFNLTAIINGKSILGSTKLCMKLDYKHSYKYQNLRFSGP